jgi:hypothetical protein
MWNAQGGYGEAGRAFGTAAEFIAIASHQAVKLADALSFADGANLGVPAMTAYRAIFSDGPVMPADDVRERRGRCGRPFRGTDGGCRWSAGDRYGQHCPRLRCT